MICLLPRQDGCEKDGVAMLEIIIRYAKYTWAAFIFPGL